MQILFNASVAVYKVEVPIQMFLIPEVVENPAWCQTATFPEVP